jgi:hypothetical protein
MKGRTIPLADAGRLDRARRRTRIVRIALVIALVALVAGAAAAATHPQGRTFRFLPKESNGVVVLDLSASISTDTFERIGQTLRQLGSTDGRYGLVVFSDVAYEALPPGTPAAELRPYARFFTLPPPKGGFLPALPANPWTDTFSGGTRISAGLGMALRLIRNDRLAHPAAILVSDLNDDPGDLKSLASVALAYRQLGIPVRIVALNPEPGDQQLFAKLLAGAATIQNATLPGERSVEHGPRIPPLLGLLTVLTAVALGVNELWSARLAWSAA